jgi:hypothetical protein
MCYPQLERLIEPERNFDRARSLHKLALPEFEREQLEDL